VSYSYVEAMKSDVRDAIEDGGYLDGDYDRDEVEEQLNEDLWVDDSVTGNASGSYTFSSYQAKEYVLEDGMDYLLEATSEFGIEASEIGEHFINEDWEWFDVTIRCYLLGQVIGEVLDELEGEQLNDNYRRRTESRRRRMKESYADDAIAILNKIRAEDDGIAQFAQVGDYTYSYCLVPYCEPEDLGQDYDGDIANCLEYTLHELIDNGYEDSVGRVMGAFERDYDDEDQNEREEYGELIDIDLGYCVNAITQFEVVEV